jgi:hypothetical protein
MTDPFTEERCFLHLKGYFAFTKGIPTSVEYALRVLDKHLPTSGLPHPSDWAPIATAPKDESRILLALERPAMVVIGYWSTDRDTWLDDGIYAKPLTETPKFWKPLEKYPTQNPHPEIQRTPPPGRSG